MTDAEKKILLDAAKILDRLKDAEGVEKINIPVFGGVLSFKQLA